MNWMRSSGMSIDKEVGQRQIWGTPEAREGKRSHQRRGRRKEENPEKSVILRERGKSASCRKE